MFALCESVIRIEKKLPLVSRTPRCRECAVVQAVRRFDYGVQSSPSISASK
jgi:hypothetical protein